MSYELEIDESALGDLERLLEEFPPHQRNPVIDAVDTALVAFVGGSLRMKAANRYIPLHFEIEGRWHFWGATYYYSQDEKQLVVGRIFKAAM
jgi:hypothetical protein